MFCVRVFDTTYLYFYNIIVYLFIVTLYDQRTFSGQIFVW